MDFWALTGYLQNLTLYKGSLNAYQGISDDDKVGTATNNELPRKGGTQF